jgi:TetR/AcrR family transcriptional regulator, cholesterol catabolism regulator
VSRRDHFERVVRNIVQQGIDEGVFRRTDTAISVNALLGAVNWMTRWYRPAGRLSPDEIADQFADLFLFGLLNKP